MLPDRSVLIGQKLVEMQKFKCDILGDFQTLCEQSVSACRNQYRQLISLCIQAMESEDSKAVWIMQGWLFLYSDFWEEPQIKAILSGAPQGSMIILDLDSTYQEQYSRTQGYYHLQPFIFNDLTNFGGGLGLFGRWDNINQRPFEARNITRFENFPKMSHLFWPFLQMRKSK